MNYLEQEPSLSLLDSVNHSIETGTHVIQIETSEKEASPLLTIQDLRENNPRYLAYQQLLTHQYFLHGYEDKKALWLQHTTFPMDMLIQLEERALKASIPYDLYPLSPEMRLHRKKSTLPHE